MLQRIDLGNRLKLQQPSPTGLRKAVMLLPQAATARSGVWDLYRDGITQGFLGSWMLCPEKARLQSVEGLRQIRTGGALAFGSLIHDLLDEIYSSHQRKVAASHGVEWDRQTFIRSAAKIALRDKEAKDREELDTSITSEAEAIDLLEENYAMAEPLLSGYLAKWSEDFIEYEWLALERTFEVEWTTSRGSNIKIRGKRDGDHRSIRSGSLLLFETKTKGRIDEDGIMDRLNFDLQVMLYLYSMWKDYDEFPAGVIYNMMRKPQLKRKVKESLREFAERIAVDIQTRPNFYFMRFQVSVVKHDMERWLMEFGDMMDAVETWYLGGGHWRNSSACSMGGMNCQFLGVCARGDRDGFKVKDTAFPELIGSHD